MNCNFFRACAILFILSVLGAGVTQVFSAETKGDKSNPSVKEKASNPPSIYDQYIQCFERVYNTMEENYYRPVVREVYDRFIAKFDKEIYGKLSDKTKKINFICWRNAAYLVDFLKDPEDIFSAFFPPKAADQYAKTALGQRVDLGIEGKLTPEGYMVSFVEPRSDAFEKGLEAEDFILAIDNVKVAGLSEKEIQEKLTPLIDTAVALALLDHKSKAERSISVISKEYFKQSVFMVPVDVPGVYCLQIKHFNRKTADDMFRFLSAIKKHNEATALIIDLRGNPGGPPLAAREIAAFFLAPDEELAYFQKKNQPKAMLSVPPLGKEYHYSGPMAILIDKGSGSASELFSGFMQKRKRAVLFGTNSAGKVMLKSMFDYDDGTMLLLVTARGYMYDNSLYPFNGLTPDFAFNDDKTDVIHMAAIYLKSTLTKKEPN